MTSRKLGGRKLAYAAMAVLAGLVILLSLSPFFGVRFDVVLSGSMSPAMNTGDLVVVSPAVPADLMVGDVIVFRSPMADALVCHRIIAMDSNDGLAFQTKGDANEDPDLFLVEPSDIVGKVQASVPVIGYAVQWLRGPFGILAIIALGAAALLLPDADHKERKEETAKEDVNAKAQDSC